MSNDKETFDPYRVLGLPVGATKQQIARRYRHLMRIHHPDVGRDPRLAHERAVQINRAYRILMDDELRARYEEQLLSDAELEIHVPGAIYAEEGNDRLARNMYNEAQRLAKDAQRSSIPVTPQRVPPEELLVPQRLTVHYWLAAVGVIAGLGLAILAGRVDGTIGFVGISWYGLLSACGGAFTMICCLAAAGAIESFDVEWSGDIVEGGGKTTPLWCYILASAAVWAGFAVRLRRVVLVAGTERDIHIRPGRLGRRLCIQSARMVALSQKASLQGAATLCVLPRRLTRCVRSSALRGCVERR